MNVSNTIIEIHCYSGRPNPKFRLTFEQEAEIMTLLPDNVTPEKDYLHEPVLGYRYVLVRLYTPHREGSYTDMIAKADSELEKYCLGVWNEQQRRVAGQGDSGRQDGGDDDHRP